jgi:RNA polymerase sigma factor (sigma-70 family)
MDDIALLHEYDRTQSNDAFRQVVERHVDWVHAVVRRQVHDPHLAHDVTQGVFLALAQKAGKIRGEVCLAGWLFKAAHFGAKGALRMERRRRFHERRAAAIPAQPRPVADAAAAAQLEHLMPMLEEAVDALRANDRNAILLRFYQRKSHDEVGRALGVTGEAAKKRVSRAVEKLRRILRRRGVTVESTALAAGLEHVINHAPAGLTSSVMSSLAAGGAGSVVAMGIAKEIISMIMLAKAKFAAVCATVAIGVGGTVAVTAVAWSGMNAPARPGNASSVAPAGGNPLRALAPAAARREAAREAAAEPRLIVAARNVDVAQVKRLIAAGGNPNAVGQNGRTSLHEVVQMSWPTDKQKAGAAIVKLLLDKGADPMATDGAGWTPIEQMGSKNDKAVAIIREQLENLLKETKPLEKPPALAPGFMGAQQGDLLVFKLRLARGANPNSADEHGRPLLHDAVRADRRELMDLLLGAGADVTLPDRTTGDTPLHVAVTSERYDTARYLIEKGADPFRANSIGHTAVALEAQKREHKLFDAGTIKVEREDAESWGPVADGVQARLRRTREAWKVGEKPVVRLDVWNHWNRKLAVDLGTMEVVIDGKAQKLGGGHTRDLSPQVYVTDVLVPLGELSPGEHRVKVRVKALARDGKEDLTVETEERTIIVR